MGTWFLGACLAAAGAANWTPPAQPDPHAILNEARVDAQAGRHEIALAKHEWFHREALTLRPSLYGVRLSFALGDWMALGQSYPPALASLKRFRDEALRQFRSGGDAFSTFHDFVAINEALDETARTRDVFLELHKTDAQAAKPVYALAKPALVEAKEYAVCGHYVQGEQDWARIAFTRATTKNLGLDESLGPEHARFSEQSFTHETALLIALLVLNERTSEAELVARKARAEWDDEGFHQAIDAALKGQVPPPFP